MYAKYMESPKVYSKDERSEMFEYVNAEFFKLKGDKRKALRKAILTWKQNKQVGAFELFVMLYNSEDKYDEKNEWFKNYIKDENMEAYKNKKSIPYAKHMRRMGWRNEEIEGLEVQLDNVLEDNKLISKSDHEEIIDKVKKDNSEVNQSLEQKIQKLEKELQYTKDSCESKIRIAQDKASFFEKECNKLGNQ